MANTMIPGFMNGILNIRCCECEHDVLSNSNRYNYKVKVKIKIFVKVKINKAENEVKVTVKNNVDKLWSVV